MHMNAYPTLPAVAREIVDAREEARNVSAVRRTHDETDDDAAANTCEMT